MSNLETIPYQGAVSHDFLNGLIQATDLVTDLRGLAGVLVAGTGSGVTGSEVYARGLATVNDGQGGLFLWNSASTAADDGVNVIEPTAATPPITGSSPGRWLRQVMAVGAGLSSSGGYLQIVNAGITNALLENPGLTLGSTALTLGGTTTALAGLTSLGVVNGSDIIQAVNDGNNHLIFSDGGSSPTVTATGTGSISGNIATITTTSGTFARNNLISGGTIAAGTYIEAVLGGGTYAVSGAPQTVTSTTITATQPNAKSVVVLNNGGITISPSPSRNDAVELYADVDPNTLVLQGVNTSGLWDTNLSLYRSSNYNEAVLNACMWAGGAVGQSRLLIGTNHAPQTGTPGPFYSISQTIEAGDQWVGTGFFAAGTAAVSGVSPGTSNFTVVSTTSGTLCAGQVLVGAGPPIGQNLQGATIISGSGTSWVTEAVPSGTISAGTIPLTATGATYLDIVFSNGQGVAFTIPGNLSSSAGRYQTSNPAPTTVFGAGGLETPIATFNTGADNNLVIQSNGSTANEILFKPGLSIVGGENADGHMTFNVPSGGEYIWEYNTSVKVSLNSTALITSAHMNLGDPTNYWGISYMENLSLIPETAPAAPAVGWTIYVDSTSLNLKAIAADGTIVTLGTH